MSDKKSHNPDLELQEDVALFHSHDLHIAAVGNQIGPHIIQRMVHRLNRHLHLLLWQQKGDGTWK